MKKTIILVNASYKLEPNGNKCSDDLFAVESGEPAKVCSDIIEGLILKLFTGRFASLEELREEIEPHAGEILDAVEGKKDSFTLYDGEAVLTLRERDVDEDIVTDREMSDLKSGDTLFIRYDADGNETGVYSVISTRERAACVPFFKKDDSGSLTLDHPMPFVAKGAEGYMVDESGVEIAGPFSHARPAGWGYYVVITPEMKWLIIDNRGEVKVEAVMIHGFSNGYITFVKDGREGFFEPCSGTVSPLFDKMEIEIGEGIRVMKDGSWGYLARDFTFLPEEDEDLADEIYWFGE